MNEEMNLTEDTNLKDDFEELFHAEPEEQDTNAQEENSAKPDLNDDVQPEPENEPKYKVNFLGEEKELPVSELVTAAQKGMNYDHVKDELNSLREESQKYEKTYKLMENMARASGMTIEDYTQMCNDSIRNNQLQAQIDRGIPEDVAKRLLELEEKENVRSAEEKKWKAEQEKQEAYAALLREYPDVKSLPDEVTQAVAAGEQPLTAYRAYENKQLKNEIAVLKKAAENKQKSTGSLIGDAPEEVDDFLSGFNSI